nr:plasmid maintenance protein [Borrelia coriaceae]
MKNSNVEKWECYNNNYNKIEEKQKDVKSIEKLQIKKYARKCNFKSNTFFSILNLELEKNAIIEILKAFKKTEDFFTKDMYKKKLVPHQKQIDLRISNKN